MIYLPMDSKSLEPSDNQSPLTVVYAIHQPCTTNTMGQMYLGLRKPIGRVSTVGYVDKIICNNIC